MNSYNNLRITLPTGVVVEGLHVGTIPKNSTATPNEVRSFYGLQMDQPGWNEVVAAQPHDRFRIQPYDQDALPFVVVIVDGADVLVLA
jgi:hypothetical protein